MIRSPGIRLVLLLFFIAAQAFGQGFDIRGTVTDSTTGERLPYVTVRITGTAKGAATNADGFYLIAGVPYGRIEISAEAIGYKTRTRSFIVQSVSQLNVNFKLTPQPIEVSEVVSEAAREPEMTDIYSSVHIVDQTTLHAVPVTGQSDLLRSLQILPGVVSTADVSAKVYVRGGAGDQNLLLLDGMKIYNPYHALGLYSTIDPDLVKSTELYTGAFPAGFGGRLSSVLNVRTRTGDATRIAGDAVLDPVASKLQLRGPLGEENTWIFNGRRSLLSDPYRDILKNSVPLSFYDFFGKLTHWSSEIGRISVETFLSGDNITSDKPDVPDYFWRNQVIGLSASGLLGDRFYVDATTYGNGTDIRLDPKESQTVLPAESKLSEFGIRAEFTVYTDSRDLYLGGFEVSTTDFENSIVNRDGTRKVVSTIGPEGSLWFRYQKTHGNLRTDFGVQFDATSLIDKGVGLYSIQPRINISYAVGPSWRVKAAYGVFTQHVVTITNEDDVVSLFEAWMQVPEALDPEQADHYVAGVEGNILPNLSVSLDGFYKTFRSIVQYNRDKVFLTDPDFIGGTGSSRGAEVLLRFSSPLLDLYGAYTLSRASLTVNGVTYPPRYDRRHTLSLMGIVRPFEQIQVSLLWEFGSGAPFTQTVGFYDRLQFSDIGETQFYNDTGIPYAQLGSRNAVRLPTYHRLDASISYRFQIASLNAEAGLHASNVYNRRNLLYFDRSTGQRVDMIPFYPSVMLRVEF